MTATATTTCSRVGIGVERNVYEMAPPTRAAPLGTAHALRRCTVSRRRPPRNDRYRTPPRPLVKGQPPRGWRDHAAAVRTSSPRDVRPRPHRCSGLSLLVAR